MMTFKYDGRQLLATCLVAVVSIAMAVVYIHNNLSSIGHALTPKYNSISANSELINYYGRWIAASNRLGKLASFPGSSIEFAVHNTSSIILDLANLKSATTISADGHQNTQVALTPARTKTAKHGPVDILITVNGTEQSQRLSGIYGRTFVLQNLNKNDVHIVRVKLSLCFPQCTIHLRAILVNEGGDLTAVPRSAEKTVPQSAALGIVQIRKKSIEVLSTASLFGFPHSPPRDDSLYLATWPDLLERRFTDIKVSMLPISNDTCLSHLCQTRNPTALQAKDIYFRAGNSGTQLHERLWTSTSTRETPTALLMMLGLTDMNVFLQTSNGTRHQAVQFVEDLARSYANLIQTIRRTACSSSALDTLQSSTFRGLEAIDESYSYNSIPSNVPIFLVMPPFPAMKNHMRSRYLRTMFSQILQKVLNELKWHIGDKSTFILDTAGWLEEEDLSTDHTFDFGLTQTGHIRFAYKLSNHLCRYVLDRYLLNQTPQCPFDRYDEYFGNLYVPETVSIGTMIEEKKVMRIKEMFGVFDYRNKGDSM